MSQHDGHTALPGLENFKLYLAEIDHLGIRKIHHVASFFCSCNQL